MSRGFWLLSLCSRIPANQNGPEKAGQKHQETYHREEKLCLLTDILWTHWTYFEAKKLLPFSSKVTDTWNWCSCSEWDRTRACNDQDHITIFQSPQQNDKAGSFLVYFFKICYLLSKLFSIFNIYFSFPLTQWFVMIVRLGYKN